MPWTESATSHRQSIPKQMRGVLREIERKNCSRDVLLRHLQHDGYAFVRGALNCNDILAARESILRRLVDVGEVKEPAIDGVYTGTSHREEIHPDVAAFWKSVCETPALRRVTHDGPMRELMTMLLGGPVRPFDYLWLRPMPPGAASAFHFDHVYMNRGAETLYTVWTPLGDIPISDGPIVLMEGSHRWDDLIAQYRGFDVDKDKTRPGHVTTEPVTLARERGCKLITADFRAGDVLIMTMFMLHGSLDNRSPEGRFRLSCDVRYQLEADPVDERWVGPNPIAHGTGYKSMGSRPAATAHGPKT